MTAKSSSKRDMAACLRCSLLRLEHRLLTFPLFQQDLHLRCLVQALKVYVERSSQLCNQSSFL